MIEVEKIVDEFEEYCIQYSIADRDLNHKVVNKCAKKIINAYLKLKELGKISALEKLIYSENETVRSWAATHLLKVNEPLAKKTLQEIAIKSDISGFDAQMTLSEWEKGNLKLNYENYKVKW
jgi:hypothetical protein